jgi:HlyD family secretion protein
VKFDLPVADGLRAGQFGRVAVPVAETQILRVPRASLRKRGQMEMVYVVRDQKATLRLVKTGKILEEDVQILSGLEEGESVIVSDVSMLGDGQPVTVQP